MRFLATAGSFRYVVVFGRAGLVALLRVVAFSLPRQIALQPVASRG